MKQWEKWFKEGKCVKCGIRLTTSDKEQGYCKWMCWVCGEKFTQWLENKDK